jgi:hypothetical protein
MPFASPRSVPGCRGVFTGKDPVRKGTAMTETTTSPALRTALAYYQAWTSHDLDQAMS